MTAVVNPAPALPTNRHPWLAPLAGLSFVVIWCTGYPAGKIVVGHSGPFTALCIRFGIAALLFGAFALIGRVVWPDRRTLQHSAVVGALQLALQFGGVYGALSLGASAGLAALVIGAMPLCVSAFSAVLGERIDRRQWLGLAIGFTGVWLVLGPGLMVGTELANPATGVDAARTPGWLAVAALVLGLVGIACGTLYQKRHGSQVDLRIGLCVQNAMATLLLLPLAIALEGFRADHSPAFWTVTAWLVLVNSVGGFALLFLLIRNGAATQVAALFYLVPAVGAIMGHTVLGEVLTRLEIAGFVVAAIGVYLATRTPAARVVQSG